MASGQAERDEGAERRAEQEIRPLNLERRADRRQAIDPRAEVPPIGVLLSLRPFPGGPAAPPE
jgi:hypothetical protein